LSYSKKTGLSGEFLFKSSSEADAIASSRTGSGGTMGGAGAGGGGRGGAGAVEEGIDAGVAGRATGALFLWHAAEVITASANIPTAIRLIVGSYSDCLNYLDQSGFSLLPALVSWRTSLPSRAMVKTCVLPDRVEVNTRWRPLGAKAGLSLLPSPNVSCRG